MNDEVQVAAEILREEFEKLLEFDHNLIPMTVYYYEGRHERAKVIGGKTTFDGLGRWITKGSEDEIE